MPHFIKIYIKMLIMFSTFSREAEIPHIACVQRAGNVTSFYIKMVIFLIILRNVWSKYTPKRTKLHHFSKFSWRNLPSSIFAMHSMQCRDMLIYTSGKIICTPLLNPVIYAQLSLFEKNHD